MGWTDRPVLAFDTETTGVSYDRDHILSGSLGMLTPGAGETTMETVWINPGVPIPAAATAIHGITNEQIAKVGDPPAEGLETLCLLLAAALREGTPIVGMNVVFDLTMLDRNCRRHGITPLSDRVQISPVIDVMVLDKKVDPFRKGSGKRKLTAICPLYRVEPGQSHSSAADALAAARVAWRIGRLYPQIGEADAVMLHGAQTRWKRSQDASFARWLKSQQKDATDCDGQWPIRLLPSEPIEEPMLWE